MELPFHTKEFGASFSRLSCVKVCVSYDFINKRV